MSARDLLDAAIAQIEGPAMHRWALRNYDVWLEYTNTQLMQKPDLDATRLCAFIMLTAMG